MKKFCKGLLAISLAFGLLCAFLQPAAAQQAGSAVVQINPAQRTMAAGETAEITVAVSNVTDLYGFDVLLKYDPQVLEVQDMDPNKKGIQVAQGVFLDAGLVAINSVDPVQGEIHFVMTQINPSTPKSGTGALVVVRFKAVKAGASSALALEQAQLASRLGEDIPAQTTDGAIQVAGSSTQVPQVTATSIPVQDGGEYIPTLDPTEMFQPTSTRIKPTVTPETITGTAAAGSSDEQKVEITSGQAGVPGEQSTSTPLAHPNTIPDAGTKENGAGDSSPWYWIGGVGFGLIGLAGLVVGLRHNRVDHNTEE